MTERHPGTDAVYGELQQGVVAIAWSVVACVGIAGCVAASDPGDLMHSDVTRVTRREGEQVECPVRCNQHGDLVSCKAECPPVVIEKRAR